MICPPEEKAHMVALINEIRDIIMNLSNLKSHEDKLQAAERMEAIKDEMKAFRRKYPNA